jgi:hypothetical protein
MALVTPPGLSGKGSSFNLLSSAPEALRRERRREARKRNEVGSGIKKPAKN